MKLNYEYRDLCWAVGDYSCSQGKFLRNLVPEHKEHFGDIHGSDGEFVEVFVEYCPILKRWIGYLHIEDVCLRFNDIHLFAKMVTGMEDKWFPEEI